MAHRPSAIHKVVSNNSEKMIASTASILGADVVGAFGEVVSCGDAGKSKYDVWDELVGDIEPSKVLVFEDNPDAIRHAIARGYNVVAVRHGYNTRDLGEIDGISAVVE